VRPNARPLSPSEIMSDDVEEQARDGAPTLPGALAFRAKSVKPHETTRKEHEVTSRIFPRAVSCGFVDKVFHAPRPDSR